MNKQNNITKKQHYVPQVYLRGFSPEYLNSDANVIEKDKYTIFFYDLTKEEQLKKPVRIKSICHENDLYEVKDEKGDIILPNYIEKHFSRLEKMFGKYREKLNKKVFQKENYKTNCFLETEEKAFWRVYIVFQILRLPETLRSAEEIFFQITDKQFTQYQIRNTARILFFPFFEEITPGSKQAFVIEFFLEQLEKMNLTVGVDRQSKIVTSDNPVFICKEDTSEREFERIIFPISSQICLFLFRPTNGTKEYKNCCFEIDEDFRKEIIKSISQMAYKQIYSNHPLDKFEKRYIREIIEERSGKGDEKCAIL